jgi:hypothetical protein
VAGQILLDEKLTGRTTSMLSHKGVDCRVLVAAVFLLFELPSAAAADCPPIRGRTQAEEAALKKLQSGDPKSFEDAMKKLFDDAIKKGEISPIQAGPPSGPAPLTVNLAIMFFPVDTPAKIEIDVNGDGKPEWVGSSWYELLRGYTYTKPGQYQVALIVHETTGKVTRYQSNPVKVLDPKLFDKELRGYWESFRTALQRKDLQAAFRCIHSKYHQPQFRTEWEDRIKEIIRGGANLLAREYTQLDFDKFQHNYEAHYLRTVPQGWMPVHFAPDADGIWRITQF